MWWWLIFGEVGCGTIDHLHALMFCRAWQTRHMPTIRANALIIKCGVSAPVMHAWIAWESAVIVIMVVCFLGFFSSFRLITTQIGVQMSASVAVILRPKFDLDERNFWLCSQQQRCWHGQ